MTKRYGTFLANDAIDIEILAAADPRACSARTAPGKSTLVKTIYGLVQPSEGEMLWQGEKMVLSGPSEARSRGIGMVFQHFSLFDNLTVAENVALGLDGKESFKDMSARLEEVSNVYGLPLDPRRQVWQLSVGERQRIEIVRALMQNPKFLILDEPTAVLTPQEADQLFVVLNRLKSEGPRDPLHQPQAGRGETALRHRHHSARRQEDLDLQSQGGDRGVAGAHDGRWRDQGSEGRGKPPDPRCRASWSTTSVSSRTIRMACGSSTSPSSSRVVKSWALPAWPVTARTNLFAALSGERLAQDPGTVVIDGHAAGHLSITKRRKLGAAFVPEERLGHGTAPRMRLSENALLTGHAASGMVQHGFVNTAATLNTVDKATAAFDVRKAKRDPEAASLSGGNLQKFIVGREILRNPVVLVVSQPTWGVDAGAAAVIRQALLDLAAAGAAVLVTSPGPRRARRNHRPHCGDVSRPFVGADGHQRSQPGKTRSFDGRSQSGTEGSGACSWCLKNAPSDRTRSH